VPLFCVNKLPCFTKLLVLCSFASSNLFASLQQCINALPVRLVDSAGLTAYEHKYSSELLNIRAENRHFERAMEEAHSLFPADPKGRSIFLRTQLERKGGDRIVALDKVGLPFFSGNSYDRGIEVEFSTNFNTTLFRTKRWSEEEADIIVLALHGQGGLPSHSRSWFQPGQVLSNVADLNLTSSKYTAVLLRNLFPDGTRFPKIHVVAIDQPGHGTGPRADGFMSMDSYLNWLERLITYVGRTKKPLIVMGRSASPPLVRELMARWERTGTSAPITAAVEIGPVYPSAEGREYDFKNFIDEATTANNPLDREVNWPGWTMSRNLMLQTTWLSCPPSRLPILTVVGKEDSVVSTSARQHFQVLSKLNPRSQYIEVSGGHDPYFVPNVSKRDGSAEYLRAYQATLTFLNNFW
jgi:alpha-beta hydrolase superfamily lysophospholipase